MKEQLGGVYEPFVFSQLNISEISELNISEKVLDKVGGGERMARDGSQAMRGREGAHSRRHARMSRLGRNAKAKGTEGGVGTSAQRADARAGSTPLAFAGRALCISEVLRSRVCHLDQGRHSTVVR